MSITKEDLMEFGNLLAKTIVDGIKSTEDKVTKVATKKSARKSATKKVATKKTAAKKTAVKAAAKKRSYTKSSKPDPATSNRRYGGPVRFEGNEWVDDGSIKVTLTPQEKKAYKKAQELAKKRENGPKRPEFEYIQAHCNNCGRDVMTNPIHAEGKKNFVCDRCLSNMG